MNTLPIRHGATEAELDGRLIDYVAVGLTHMWRDGLKKGDRIALEVLKTTRAENVSGSALGFYLMPKSWIARFDFPVTRAGPFARRHLITFGPFVDSALNWAYRHPKP